MEYTTKNRIPYIASMVVVLTAIVLVMIASYMAFVGVKVVVPNVQPYRSITKTVLPGDTYIYEVDACKYKAVPSVVTRRFVDDKGTRYPQPPETSNLQEGCSVIRVPVAVPELHSGVWYMDIEVSYKVNPLRSENYHFTTETFTVLDKE